MSERRRHCLTCRAAFGRLEQLQCGKRIRVSGDTGRLFVGAYYVCPLWSGGKKVPHG